jgi:hypothetical protein
VAEHLWAEIPRMDINEKDKRTIIAWDETDEDNELFDNLVGCFSGFIKEGCTLYTPKAKAERIDIQALIDAQKE